MAPKISIILPTYNGKDFIKESIESVLAQKFKDFELLIIDDHSTDNSKKIIEPFLKDKRVKYFSNSGNLGLILTLNKGLSLAKGKYIARIDDDDEWIDKFKLLKQFQKLEDNPKLALIGSNVQLYDLNSGLVKITNLPTKDNQIRKQIIFNNQFLHTAVVFRKNILSKIGFYRNIGMTKYVEDYDLWLRIASRYQVENIPDVCTLVRLDQKGESASNFYMQKINGFKLAYLFAKNFPGSEFSLVARSMRMVIPKNLSYFLRSRI